MLKMESLKRKIEELTHSTKHANNTQSFVFQFFFNWFLYRISHITIILVSDVTDQMKKKKGEQNKKQQETTGMG